MGEKDIKLNTSQHALRLLPGGASRPADTAKAESPPNPGKSHLGRFFTAWADAIDQQVEIIKNL